ncbi:outer envelope protein 61 [Nymphaea colorata]|nr:outer envelope protein 61 [Nymphaea colorata]
MFNGMMDPEIMKMAQEQLSRMPPGELAKLQQQLMSNPELVKLATEGMKNMRPDDVRNAAEQLKYARSEDMADMAEKIAKATPEEIAAMRTQADAQITYELNACEMLKKQGNDLHGHGKYRDAAQKYLHAKENLKKVPVSQGKKLQLACSLNLMSCFLKMKQYEDCVKEGTEVLQYDTQNAKALYRRGQAYKELGNIKAAVSDLSKASTISPDDETITDVLRQTKELLKEHEEPRTSGVVIEEIIEETESSTSDIQENHPPKEYSVLQPEDTAEKSQVHNRSVGNDSSGFNVDAQRLQELKDNPEAIRSFHTFLANANPDALAALGGPGMAPEMVKTMSNMVSKMSAEELQKMLEVASSLNGTNPLFRPSTSAATESQTSVAAPSVRDNREASTSSSRSTFMGSEMPPSYNPTGDVQEQMRNQMRDPAMRQMFASMIKNMNPEMMANMSEQSGFKLSKEDAVKAQQAMSSLSPDDLERMMRWADKIQNVAEGARKTKNWLLGRKGLILAIAMLILAVILHWMGYIGG